MTKIIKEMVNKINKKKLDSELQNLSFDLWDQYYMVSKKYSKKLISTTEAITMFETMYQYGLSLFKKITNKYAVENDPNLYPGIERTLTSVKTKVSNLRGLII